MAGGRTAGIRIGRRWTPLFPQHTSSGLTQYGAAPASNSARTISRWRCAALLTISWF